jgi:phytanoyl-CoA hydroxylase
VVATPTHSSPPLISPEQVAQFHRDGYCVVDGLFSPAETDAIEAFFEDFKRLGLSVYDNGHKFEEVDPTKVQLRAMHPHRYSERAKAWALHPRVTAVLAALLGRDPLLAQTMYYFKPPGAKGQGMHQDNFYLLAEPHTCIAAWTAIDAATIDNGCLYVVPGSNQKNIHCPAEGADTTWMSYGDTHIKPFPKDAKAVPVEVPRGATMFFGGNLIHGSGPNRTKDRSRRTFIGHYIDETSDQIAQFYHPILNLRGEPVTNLKIPAGGGPCGDGWLGATH